MSEIISEQVEDWDLIIEPQNRLLSLKIREVWRYRDLLLLFVRRDIVSFYKQTILGPVWFFIQPVFTTIVYVFIFGNLAGLSTDGLPQTLFYLAGITAWNYFADCLNKTSTVFRDNSSIFGKVYFPRIIMPLSIILSNLMRFGIQMLLFLLVLGFYLAKGAEITVDFHLFLFPIFVVAMAMQGLGLGMIVSAMTTKYRDLAFLLTFGVQLLMYATTVIYPLSSLSGKLYYLVALNPMTFVIEGFRKSLLGIGMFDGFTLSYTIISSSLILLFGLLIFNKVEKDFVDTI
ncbi:ABC transporter permease [Algoriphagus sp.]|uniref:ABC transporter permease n=1 Tax=Algoriphagus sp. TaxID=1872435 RepID=UPI0027307A9F|nr:ABC transporter permease [Algoriphagus sp.]MDP2040492.1 ABC transporter permease [Algoriphagus sp.]